MTEAKLAPHLPGWMVEHANRYLSSGGTDGHLYKITPPGYPEMTVPALLVTTTGRKSGERFIFPLFYGKTGDGYLVVASKGGAPQHPGWYRNLLANPDVDVQVGTTKLKARARTATVCILTPPDPGSDWNDVLIGKAPATQGAPIHV